MKIWKRFLLFAGILFLIQSIFLFLWCYPDGLVYNSSCHSFPLFIACFPFSILICCKEFLISSIFINPDEIPTLFNLLWYLKMILKIVLPQFLLIVGFGIISFKLFSIARRIKKKLLRRIIKSIIIFLFGGFYIINYFFSFTFYQLLHWLYR